MKRLFTIIAIAIASITANAQCGVGFQSVTSPSGSVDFFAYVSVNDSASYPITYTWSFGDGSSGTSTSSNITHQYTSTTGAVIACVYIQTATGCTSNFCDSVSLSGQSGCFANFSYNVDSVNTPDDTYSFLSSCSPDMGSTIVSYSWDFGDGSTSTLLNPVHTYMNPGTYQACLYISTSSGCVSTSCTNIVVANTGCQIYANLFSQSPSTIGGNDGYIETNVFGGTAPYAYIWNTGQVTANIYNLTSGLYTLNITDANGCANTFTAMLYEPNDSVNTVIVDTLYTNPLDTCLNFVPTSYTISSVTLDSINGTVTVVWTFTGSGTTTSIVVQYLYSQTGNNMVVLVLNCGTKSLTTYVSYIHIATITGLESIYGSETDLVAYPIPFNDKLMLGYYSSGKTTIRMIDATGRQVVYVQTNNTGAATTEINTSGLPSGIYILNIENNGKVIHKQVVK